MKTAPIPRRILAYLIDSLLAFLVFVLAAQLLFFVPLCHLVIGSEDWFRSGWNTQLYTLLTMSLPAWLYFALSEISPWGATLGKRLLKLKTVTKATHGKMTLLQSLGGRWSSCCPGKWRTSPTTQPVAIARCFDVLSPPPRPADWTFQNR